MDLIKQNKFISWVIAILVALNLLTLSMIWLQSDNRNPAPRKEGGNSPSAPVVMLQRELQLSADQEKQYEALWIKHQEQIKQINDMRDNLRLRMADAIFNPSPDGQMVDSIAKGIGSLETRMEMLRYENFRGLMQICNAEQKAKLQPILREAIRRKGPTDKPENTSDRPEAKPRERKEEAGGQPLPRQDGRPVPPSAGEKLQRYMERLSLTPEQSKMAENLFRQSRAEEEIFKFRNKRSPEAFEAEKKRINKEEDDRLLQILSPEQKSEFEKMKKNREKRRPQPPPEGGRP